MKKIKISELPIVSSLKGLFTIGVDNQNRSVKVSLQFVEDTTAEAVKNAETATKSATDAATAAQTAKKEADTATAQAQTATKNADTATAQAQEATSQAQSAATQASSAASAANTATERANAATEAANEATAQAHTATEETEAATAAAQEATAETLAKIAVLVPSALTVEAPKRLTWGNVQPVKIRAELSPETAMKNVIFISDNRAVDVGTDGTLTIVSKGVSRVHVIPTQNTALAKTCLIEVGDPSLRLASNRQTMRFTQSGGLRLT